MEHHNFWRGDKVRLMTSEEFDALDPRPSLEECRL